MTETRQRIWAVRHWRDCIRFADEIEEPEYRDVSEPVVRVLALAFARDREEPGASFRGSLADLAHLAGVSIGEVAMTVDRLIGTGEIKRLRFGLVATTKLDNGEIVSILHPDAQGAA